MVVGIKQEDGGEQPAILYNIYIFFSSLVPTYFSDNLIQLTKDFDTYSLNQNILSQYIGIDYQVLKLLRF